MVVCRFFLEGRCKYGDYCRFEHEVGNQYDTYGHRPNYENSYRLNKPSFREDYYRNSNDHNYVPVKPAPPPPRQTAIVKPSAQGNSAKVQQLFEDIMKEVVAVERGGQWPLSSFGPLKDCQAMPDLEDTSPEELRWNYHVVKNSGRPINEYVQRAEQLLKKASAGRKFLKDPSERLWKFLEDIATGRARTTTTSSSSAAKSTFRFDTSSNQSAATGSIFGQAPSSQQSTPSIFSQPPVFSQQSTTTNIFSNANQQSLFGAIPSSSASIFSSQNAAAAASHSSSAKLFPSQTNTDAYSAFGTVNVFASQPNSASTFGNVGQPTSSAAASAFSAQSTVAVVSVDFSVLEDLTDEEKVAFESATFALGKIPLKPPTQTMC